jgi:hypothetical protein
LREADILTAISEPIVRFEVFTAVTMKNGVFWDVTPRGFCENRRFGGTYCLHPEGEKYRRARDSVSSN